MEHFLKTYPKANIYIVAFDVNEEAPFIFENIERLTILNRRNLDSADVWQLIENIQPKAIFCSGWVDKMYLNTINIARHSFKTILILDNPWLGTFKQRLLLPYARFYLRKLFWGCWVPGQTQKEFMLKVGFKNDKIKTGFYATDTQMYNNLFKTSKRTGSIAYPKVLCTVARYIPQKGLEYVWQAFIELKKEFPNTWEMWCYGSGTNFTQRVIHESILHKGFIQPADLMEEMKNMGVFILPSLMEPWGMVVHEFAAAGFPLLLSDKVFSGSAFLKNEENGFVFKPKDVKSIKEVLLKITQMKDEELVEMAKKSIEKSKSYGSNEWNDTLSSF